MTEMRLRQLIVPSGVGAIVNDVAARSMVIRSLDSWFPERGLDLAEFMVSDQRLRLQLGVPDLRRPPDWKAPNSRSPGEEYNIGLTIPAFRFPTWWVCRAMKCHWMRQGQRGEASAPCCERSGCKLYGKQMVQIPMALACVGGCLTDIPWRALAGCPPDCQELFLAGTGGVPERKLVCKVHRPQGVSLAEITVLADGKKPSGFARLYERTTQTECRCPGIWDWQGRALPPGQEGFSCPHVPAASFLNALSLHTTITSTSIYIPSKLLSEGSGPQPVLRRLLNDPECEIGNEIRFHWDALRDILESGASLGSAVVIKKVEAIQRLLLRHSAKEVSSIASLPAREITELLARASDVDANTMPSELPHGRIVGYRKEEYAVLIRGHSESEFATEPLGRPSGTLGEQFEFVVKVRRLRQTTVGLGFYRFGQPPGEQSERVLAKRAVRQYFAKYRQLTDSSPMPSDAWLPAISTTGEGLMFGLRESRIAQWLGSDGQRIYSHVAPAMSAFVEARKAGVHSPVRNAEPAPDREEFFGAWFVRHTLIHTLAHVLIAQLAYDCGYSEDALAERLYVSADRKSPMAAALIFTASGDSEGTLGGVSSIADPIRLGGVLRRGLERARTCASDPICSERVGSGSQVAAFNGAACHCCSMLPDISCENGNRMLDRAVLINPEFGFFRHMA